MKDCELCEYYVKIFYGTCKKDHELEFRDGCEKCGTPYARDVFWKNLRDDENNECPDFEWYVADDPSGS